jgi:hypothetical protein
LFQQKNSDYIGPLCEHAQASCLCFLFFVYVSTFAPQLFFLITRMADMNLNETHFYERDIWIFCLWLFKFSSNKFILFRCWKNPTDDGSKSSKESPTFNCELEFNVNVDKKTTGQNLVDQVVKALGIRGVNILISYFFMKWFWAFENKVQSRHKHTRFEIQVGSMLFGQNVKRYTILGFIVIFYYFFYILPGV